MGGPATFPETKTSLAATDVKIVHLHTVVVDKPFTLALAESFNPSTLDFAKLPKDLLGFFIR
jgi:hypothetical protein